jgi:hypothetical protein
MLCYIILLTWDLASVRTVISLSLLLWLCIVYYHDTLILSHFVSPPSQPTKASGHSTPSFFFSWFSVFPPTSIYAPSTHIGNKGKGKRMEDMLSHTYRKDSDKMSHKSQYIQFISLPPFLLSNPFITFRSPTPLLSPLPPLPLRILPITLSRRP